MDSVLLICSRPHVPWQGASIRLVHTIDVLTYLGYHVEVLTIPLGSGFYSSAQQIHVTSRFLFSKSLPKRKLSFRRFYYNLCLIRKAAALALRKRYSVIHGLHDGNTAATCAAWFSRTPLILEHHSGTANAPARCSWLSRILCRRADGVVGAASSIVQLMKGLECAGRVCHIPDIPSLLELPEASQIARTRQIWTQGHDVKIIVCLGSAEHFNGMENFKAAMLKLAETRHDLRFVWIGGNTREIAHAKAFFKEHAPNLEVNFSGCLLPESLALALAAADIIFIPRIRGIDAPMKLLDAFASGVPVLTVDCPAAQRLIASGTGIVTEDTPEALAEALAALADDPNARKALAKAARRHVEQAHSFEYFSSAYRQCYAYVINRHRKDD